MYTQFREWDQNEITRLYRKEGWSIKAIAKHMHIGDKRISAYLRGKPMRAREETKQSLFRAGSKKSEKNLVQTAIFSPVEVSIDTIDGKKYKKVIKGALITKRTVDAIVKLICKSNANGLKGGDAMLLMALRGASDDLAAK